MLVRMWRDSDNDYWTFFLLQYLHTSLGFCGWPSKQIGAVCGKSVSKIGHSVEICSHLTQCKSGKLYSLFLSASNWREEFMDRILLSPMVPWEQSRRSRVWIKPKDLFQVSLLTMQVDISLCCIAWPSEGMLPLQLICKLCSYGGSSRKFCRISLMALPCRIDPRYWQDSFVFAANSPFYDVFSITGGKRTHWGFGRLPSHVNNESTHSH